jgi:hypothetical protein
VSDSQDFDPRFDPAYQRGFSGEVTASRRRAVTGAPSVAPAAAAPSSVAAPVVVTPAEPVEAEHSEHSTEEVESAPVTAVAAARIRLVSGWTISIAVVGVLLILGGGWGVNSLIESMSAADAGASANFYLVLFGVFASPLAVALGLACLIGLLFLGATTKRR